jgi:hypothetical protein
MPRGEWEDDIKMDLKRHRVSKFGVDSCGS